MAKGKGKNNMHGRSSNPQSGSSRGIEKRFRKDSTQQGSRIYPDVSSYPSGIARSANSSWTAAHGEKMVSMDQLPGYIFMCNGKTKEDCFKYRVFGLPPTKVDALDKIKPHMKLFLFDFDLKLLHGIFVAASNGRLAIEPTAFGGKFSAQVRFEIFKDCLPLPESVFKHIINENYHGSHKFKQELSGNQVNNLISLFRPVPMSLPAEDEPPGYQAPHAWAKKIQPMHLPPVGTQLPSELLYPAEAHQFYRPKNPALPPHDPYSRYVPAKSYVTGPSQFSKALRGHTTLPPSTRTAAYWAAVASEGLKQAGPDTYQGMPSGHVGLGLPVTSARAALTPPPVLESIDAKLLQQLGSTVNDNHQNPAVASASPIVQEPAVVPSQFQGIQAPMYETNGHLQPSSSSTAGYWIAVASEDPNLAYPAPYQWQSSINTGVGAENVSSGSAPHYYDVQGSADDFVPHEGTSSDYYTQNVNLATTNGPVQAHDQVTYYASAPAYWSVVPSQDPNQLYSGYYQVQSRGSSFIGGEPNQLSSGSYQVLPPGSSGLGGEHASVASVTGAAANNY